MIKSNQTYNIYIYDIYVLNSSIPLKPYPLANQVRPLRLSGHGWKGEPRQVVHEARGLARNGGPQDLRQDVLQKRREHDDLFYGLLGFSRSQENISFYGLAH